MWLLIGYVEEDKIVVDDPAFTLTSIFGRIGLVAYVVCTAIVALNMLIAMMNNSYDRVMVRALSMLQNRYLILVLASWIIATFIYLQKNQPLCQIDFPNFPVLMFKC